MYQTTNIYHSCLFVYVCLCDYQVIVLQDHVVWLRLPAEAHQADDVGVAELAEHFGFTAEVELKLLISGLQAFYQHHRLLLVLFDTFSFG